MQSDYLKPFWIEICFCFEISVRILERSKTKQTWVDLHWQLVLVCFKKIHVRIFFISCVDYMSCNLSVLFPVRVYFLLWGCKLLLIFLRLSNKTVALERSLSLEGLTISGWWCHFFSGCWANNWNEENTNKCLESFLNQLLFSFISKLVSFLKNDFWHFMPFYLIAMVADRWQETRGEKWGHATKVPGWIWNRDASFHGWHHLTEASVYKVIHITEFILQRLPQMTSCVFPVCRRALDSDE